MGVKKFFILTDLEGVVGVEAFRNTRTREPEPKLQGMKQLAKEVHACIQGIRSVVPDAIVDVWDGHGPGGLLAEDILEGNYLREGKPYLRLEGYSAMLFVGQHAMAGTFNAPLNHTYSSLNVAYYKLNGTFIGEFGARALIAGVQGVPTIFLSGDDKAALEAKLFIPGIQTAVVKRGLGLEAADHLEPNEACELIRQESREAVLRMDTIAPFTGFAAPYELEIRFLEPRKELHMPSEAEVSWLDEQTVRLRTDRLADLPI